MRRVLPPFKARNERERTAMIEWVHGVLDEYFEEFYYYERLSEAEDECRKRGYTRLETPGAVEAARQGDASYLRRLYPEIAEFIHPPRLKRGQKRESPGPWDHVRETANVIRRIWQARYRKQRRHPDDGPSAEEIAAAYHGLDPSEVSWKPSGRHKPGPRKRRAK
jgi:hypothetical protein